MAIQTSQNQCQSAAAKTSREGAEMSGSFVLTTPRGLRAGFCSLPVQSLSQRPRWAWLFIKTKLSVQTHARLKPFNPLWKKQSVQERARGTNRTNGAKRSPRTAIQAHNVQRPLSAHAAEMSRLQLHLRLVGLRSGTPTPTLGGGAERTPTFRPGHPGEGAHTDLSARSPGAHTDLSARSPT